MYILIYCWLECGRTNSAIAQTQYLLILTVPLETLKKFLKRRVLNKWMSVYLSDECILMNIEVIFFIELVIHVTLATTDYSLFPWTNPALCNKNRLLYNTQWHLCLIDECLCYVRLPASCNSLGYNLGPTHICLTNITYISQSRKPVSN